MAETGACRSRHGSSHACCASRGITPSTFTWGRPASGKGGRPQDAASHLTIPGDGRLTAHSFTLLRVPVWITQVVKAPMAEDKPRLDRRAFAWLCCLKAACPKSSLVRRHSSRWQGQRHRRFAPYLIRGDSLSRHVTVVLFCRRCNG